MSRAAEVSWLEQTIADVPATNAWLAPAEQEKLRSFRIPKRACDWRMGRWTAKRALARRIRIPGDDAALASIEIVPAESGAPLAFFGGEPAAWTISISHSSGRAACATAPGEVPLGCDLERIEPRTGAFLSDYFTEEEQRAISDAAKSDQALLATLFWSAKESALKAVAEGLRADTRSASVTRVGCPSPWSLWAPLAVRLESGAEFEGWWHADREFVRTVVALPMCSTPFTSA